MRVYCKKSYHIFEQNKYYIANIHSVFVKDDFIAIEASVDLLYRFRMNKSTECIEGYIGDIELYFYDYFNLLKDERKQKLKKLSE